MKNDLLLENNKTYEYFYNRNSSQNEVDFFYSKLSYDTRTSLLIGLRPLVTQNGFIL